MKDGAGNTTFEIFTTYRKGDKISLNYKQIELIANRVKNGEIHPFENAPFHNKENSNTPGGEMLRRFNKGEIATVNRKQRGIVFFEFNDGFESQQVEKWLKKI